MALYNKFRSQTFGDIKGQETAVRILKSGLAKKGIDGIPQVSIFVGPHGTGKTSMAKILAKAVNCENLVDGEPCCECQSCKDIAGDVSPCVTMLDAAANGDVAHVRDIIEDCKYVPNGNKKVYILDEVQMFSNSAWNALLKTLEEPPKDVFFILCTTESLKIAATAKSRCQEVLFKSITIDVIKEQLSYISDKEGIVADDDALMFIAESADGHMRDAISDLEKYSSYDRITKGMILDDKGLADEESCRVILNSVLSGECVKASATLTLLQKKGKDMKKLCGSLIRLITDSVLGNAPLGFSEDSQVRLQKALIKAYPSLSVPQASFYLDAVLVSALKDEAVIASLQRKIDELVKDGVKVSAVAEVKAEEVNVIPFEKKEGKETLFDVDDFRAAAERVYGLKAATDEKSNAVVTAAPTVVFDSGCEKPVRLAEAVPVADVSPVEVSIPDEPEEMVSVAEEVSKIHFELYQLKCVPETEEKWAKSYEYIQKKFGTPVLSDYTKVYEGDTELTLEEIFVSLQDVKTPGYKGRSSSTSDIYHYGDEYFYVDRIGFKKIWDDGVVEAPEKVSEPVTERKATDNGFVNVAEEDIASVESMFGGEMSGFTVPIEEEMPLPTESYELDIPDEDEPVNEVVEEVAEVVAEETPIDDSKSVVGKVLSYEDMIALAQGDIKAPEVQKKEEKKKEKSSGGSILTMDFFDDFNKMFSSGSAT